jgi:hypothetical protein
LAPARWLHKGPRTKEDPVMKRSILFALALVAGCNALGDGEAGSDIVFRHPPVQPPPLAVYLSIESVEPAVPIEGQPMHIVFNMWNDTPQVRNGWVGAQVSPTNAAPYVSMTYSPDWAISNLAAFASARGEVTIPAPARADRGHSFSIFYYETMQVVAEFNQPGPHIADSGPQSFDEAARYFVGVDSLKAEYQRDRTASIDHDIGACGGQMTGGPAINCTPENDENVHDFGYVNSGGVLNGNVQAGPFNLVPHTNTSLTFAFGAMNTGSLDLTPLATTLNDISSITAAVLSAVYPSYAAAWAAVNQATQAINNGLFTSGCNGQVADDKLSWDATQLDGLTQANGYYQESHQYGTDPLPSNSPYITPWDCGHHPVYDVNYGIRRVPWGPSDRLKITPEQKHLAQNQAVVLSSNAADPSKVVWSVEGASQTGYFVQNGASTSFVLSKALAASDMVILTGTDVDGTIGHAYLGGPLAITIHLPPGGIHIPINLTN